MLRKLKKAWSDPFNFMLDSRVAPLAAVGKRITDYYDARYMAVGAAASDKCVAVIMTAYHTGELLRKAAESVLSQSHENLELWIIDDASRDETPDIAADIARSDRRVKAFQAQTNHGTYWSKNWCLAQVNTPYVAFHDSDDISLKHRLRYQVGAMELHQKLMACTVYWRRLNETGDFLKINGRDARASLISTMIRRDQVMTGIGYFDNVRISADSEYVDRVVAHFGRRSVKNLRQVHYHGLLRDNSLTTAPGSGLKWTQDEDGLKREMVGDRLSYHQAYAGWHSSMRFKSTPYIAFPPVQERHFEAPETMKKNCDDTALHRVSPL